MATRSPSRHRNITQSDEELNDLHVTTVTNLIQRDYPVIVQRPSLVYANGFQYCPVQTIQILHNGAHHWLLLSSLDGTVMIYEYASNESSSQADDSVIFT